MIIYLDVYSYFIVYYIVQNKPILQIEIETIFQILNGKYNKYQLHPILYIPLFYMQTRLAKQIKQAQKHSKSIPDSTNVPEYSNSCQKQDKQYFANIKTYLKFSTTLKQNGGCNKFTFTYNNKKTDRFNKARTIIVSTYSKLQLFFNLTMQSMFLAIDLFDKFIQISGEEHRSDIQDIGLACFMIAIKYEEIYPPSLTQIQAKMKSWISFNQYMEKQFQILGKLDYNITMQSPLQYFKNFTTQLTEQEKSYVYLYLQLAAISPSIKKQYSWGSILQAIKILFEPLTQELDKNTPRKTYDCLQKLLKQRTRLSQAYFWINRKYSESKFHFVAKKPSYPNFNI